MRHLTFDIKHNIFLVVSRVVEKMTDYVWEKERERGENKKRNTKNARRLLTNVQFQWHMIINHGRWFLFQSRFKTVSRSKIFDVQFAHGKNAVFAERFKIFTGYRSEK